MEIKKEYSSVISLGFFCSVAQELDRIGLRSHSYPFDWLISDLRGVLAAINTHFKDFLLLENLAQYEHNPSYYKDMKYNMQFYHDFDGYLPLEGQLPAVREKFSRRIERFYADISRPTLFLRYICDQAEADWIIENREKILSLLRSFNENNDMIWIANSDIRAEGLDVFFVEKDKNDYVARVFLESNRELKELLLGLEYKDRAKNTEFYNKHNSPIKKTYKKIRKKAVQAYKRRFRKAYSHPLKYK